MGVASDYRARYEQQVRDLRDAGYTYRAIAEKMDLPESTVRTWYNTAPRRRPADEPAMLLFNAICWYKFNNDGLSPKREDLCEILGYGTGHLHSLLRTLERRGWIKWSAGEARTIVVVGGQWLPPARYRNSANIPPKRVTVRYRLKKTQREALRKAGLLCECECGKVEWVKMIQQGNRKPEPLYMCDYCAKDEGSEGLERIEQ